jgi:predicted lipid-binding transport protein (Tim44 family)
MFPAIQAAWGSGDIRRLDPYVSATLGDHLRHELAAFERDGVRPRVEDPRLQEVTVLSAGTEDRPILEVLFTARDWLADLRSGAVVGGDPERVRSYRQRWHLARGGQGHWFLDRVVRA